MKILVVEDNQELREILTEDLADAGIEVFNVADGYAALDFLKKESVDVVITDLKMPKIDGVGLRSLAKDQGILGVKLWFVYTGHVDISPDEIKELGFDEILYKPLMESTLKRMIRQKFEALNEV